MLSFFVDCHCVDNGMLTSYVVATDPEHAKRIMKRAVTHTGVTVLETVSYQIDEIPADCAYFGPSGQLMPSLADQIRHLKVARQRVFRTTNLSCCSCGSHYLHLCHEFACDGFCVHCKKARTSPGCEALVEII